MRKNNLLNVLTKDMQKKSLLKHPFYQMWNKGELTKEALIGYAKQYYHFTDNFPRFVALIFKNCKDSKIRQEIIKNLVEEELGDYNNVNPHAKQWLKFCNALGIKESDAKDSRLLDATKDFLATFEALTDKNLLEGAACALAYEMQVSDIAKTKKDGLLKFYGIRGDGLEFFDTHMKADIEHIKTWKKILRSSSPKTHSTIRKSFNKSLDAQWHMLDGILERYGSSKNKAMCS